MVSSNCWCQLYMFWERGRVGFYPDVSEILDSAVHWKWRMLRSCCQDQHGVYLLVPIPSHPPTIHHLWCLFSVQTTRPLGRWFCLVAAGDSSIIYNQTQEDQIALCWQ